MDAPWQIRLLGTLSAQQDEIVLTRFATSRVAALLARLALFPQRTHSREELAGILWPEADADAGRLNLRVALASLRRQMEPPGSLIESVFITDRGSIRFQPQACSSDAARFETALREAAQSADLPKKRAALHRALALYEGELLPGFYDEWILEERERLQALRDEAESEYRALLPVSAAEELPERVSEEFREKASEDLKDTAGVLPGKVLGFPSQFTRFFGRAPEKARLLALLSDPDVRLVTLLGPGGAGKTRLAVETARLAAGSFDGLVCFVPLADIGDSALIASAIASALRLPLAGDRSPLVQVAVHLSAGPTSSQPSAARSLLVLDNMEHLGEAGAAETRALLEQTPHLTCLVTSRQKLNLEGEQELFLSPLPVPTIASSQPEMPGHLVTYPSVQLFVDRAQAVRPDFQVTSGNAEAVAAVCRSLEGMPLALELAAARIQALTPKQMQMQLETRLDFLTSRRRDLPPRHRSLRATLEWSLHLLTPEQTRFFAGLSVFRGGWTLEAAGTVCETDSALTLLEQLRERSLIISEEPSSPIQKMRFRLLESMREFGDEQLSPAERQALSRRHADYFRQFATQMDALWDSPQQVEAAEALDAEYDNLRAALLFCQADPPDPAWDAGETGLRLAGSLGSYWTLRGLLHEGRGWLEKALTGEGSEAARAEALTQAGWLDAGRGEYQAAAVLLTEAIALCRRLEEPAALSIALRIRGIAALWQGDYLGAAPDLEEALTVGRESGDDFVVGCALNSLGVLIYQGQHDKATARCLYEEALPLLLGRGAQQRASYCLHNLGCIAHEFEDYDRADALLRHSLRLADSLGDLWHRAYCLRSLGDVLRERHDLPGAAQLLEEACTLNRRLGDRMSEAGTLHTLALVRRKQGDWAAATATCQEALRLYQALGHAEGRGITWLCLAETAGCPGALGPRR